MPLGFCTTLALAAAVQGLAAGKTLESGATLGTPVKLRELVGTQIGEAAPDEKQLHGNRL